MVIVRKLKPFLKFNDLIWQRAELSVVHYGLHDDIDVISMNPLKRRKSAFQEEIL